jgi:ATPase subunit of ABC transporter with duplicated ATPase domains
MPTPAIICSDLSFAWPDGRIVLDGLDATLPAARTGLVGLNGCGKSTLLRLVAGELKPTCGSVVTSDAPAYLPQRLDVGEDGRLDDLLGIAAARRALAAVLQGDPDPSHLEVIADDWDIEERTHAVLSRLGLGHLGFDRPAATLSGGERVLAALGARLVMRPKVLLLDEPTNNLDRPARALVIEAVDAFRGCLVVVSHDREVLEHVDQVAELRHGRLRVVGGTYTAYEQVIADEQEVARQRVRTATAQVRREKRDLEEHATRQARHDRFGRMDARRSGMPKIMADARRRKAQESAGRLGGLHEGRLAEARQSLDEAENAVRDDDPIAVDLPGTAVPPRRMTLRLRSVDLPTGQRVDLELRGADRVALLGVNGAGKTTLLRAVVGELEVPGEVRVPVPLGYLPQDLDVLDDALSVVENVEAAAPGSTSGQIRGRLARMHLRGRAADQPAVTLSGGERFRATLAALLLAEPPPRLLVLDEPTNNLDLTSVGRLGEALSAYRGSLLIVSHDVPFLRTLGITTWMELDAGGLRVTDPA